MKIAVSRGRLLGLRGIPTKQLMEREDVHDGNFEPRENGKEPL